MEASGKTGDGGYTRADLGVAAALLAAALLVGTVAVRAPSIAGMYADDGIYLATAKALADGRGYRHLELPGEPYQTKYPILYPAVLAVIWRLWPDFPANMLAVQLVNVALWTLGSWWAYRLMRRAWGLPWWLAAGGVLLALVNPLTVELIRTAMSEPLYYALSMGALLAMTYAAERAAAGRGSLGWAAGAGLLAAAAYLTRSIGITLAVALALTTALRRRWKDVVVVVVAAALAVGGWRLWCASAARSNAANPAFDVFRYNLDYSAWLTTDPGTVAWVAYQNTSALALALFRQITALPVGWMDRMIERGPAAAWPLYLALVATVAFTVAGFVSVGWRRRPETHIYLCVYLGLVLIWPFEPTRFLAPVQSLLTTLALAGLYRTALFAVRKLAASSRASRPAAEAVWTADLPGAEAGFRLVVILVLFFGYVGVRTLFALQRAGRPGEPAPPTEGLIAVVRDRTPPDAIIMFGEARTGYVHLRTGRKCVSLAPPDAPVAFSYARDRSFADCGRRMTPRGYEAFRQWMRDHLLEYLERTGATYLVTPAGERVGGRAFADLRERFPGRFQIVERNAGPYVLYRVLPGAERHPAP